MTSQETGGLMNKAGTLYAATSKYTDRVDWESTIHNKMLSRLRLVNSMVNYSCPFRCHRHEAWSHYAIWTRPAIHWSSEMDHTHYSIGKPPPASPNLPVHPPTHTYPQPPLVENRKTCSEIEFSIVQTVLHSHAGKIVVPNQTRVEWGLMWWNRICSFIVSCMGTMYFYYCMISWIGFAKISLQ